MNWRRYFLIFLVFSLLPTAAFSGQIVWESPKKGVYMSDVGKSSGAERDATICFYELEKAVYCTKIQGVGANKSIFRVAKKYRKHVKLGQRVELLQPGQEIPDYQLNVEQLEKNVAKKPASQVVKKAKSRIRREKRRKRRKKKKIEPSGWDEFLEKVDDVTVLSIEGRQFNEKGLYEDQEDLGVSMAAQIELDYTAESSEDSFGLTLFGRADSTDKNRTHWDIRELEWVGVSDKAELKLGIRKVFWGITESQHLVDIVNQTDFVEDPDSEQKLGQPMVNMTWVDDWGTLDLFILPLFRERTFPSEDGRFRLPLPIEEKAEYEAKEEDKHVDWAGRYYHSFDYLDIGLSWFMGTAREPEFLPVFDESAGSTPGASTQIVGLRPYYRQVSQVGLELQFFVEAFLAKLEIVNRNQTPKSYRAHTSGFEYTFSSLWGSSFDFGVVTEYSFDERRENAPSLLENDYFAGFRLTGNDGQSTEILVGAYLDAITHSVVHAVEARRRVAEDLTIKFISRGFSTDDDKDHLYPLRKDSYNQLELSYYL